jgi:hypothetical protein
MTIIGSYTNQKAAWKRVTGTDQFGDHTHATATIDAQWEWKTRLVRDSEGVERTSSARVYTNAPVQAGDTLTDPDGVDWVVIRADQQVWLNGKPAHREVYV